MGAKTLVLSLLLIAIIAAPAATAATIDLADTEETVDAPWCGPYAGVRCFNGQYFCQVWIGGNVRYCAHL